jgi:hypothetical protein
VEENIANDHVNNVNRNNEFDWVYSLVHVLVQSVDALHLALEVFFCLGQIASGRRPMTQRVASNDNDSWREQTFSLNIFMVEVAFRLRLELLLTSTLSWPLWTHKKHCTVTSPLAYLETTSRSNFRACFIWNGVNFMAHRRTKMLDLIEETPLLVVACV